MRCLIRYQLRDEASPAHHEFITEASDAEQVIRHLTEFLHPGTTIDLLDLTGLSNVSLAAGATGALTPTALPLVFSSSTQGAAVWASSELLLWDGTFEMADDAFVSRLQAAVDTGRMLNGNLTVEAQLFSPVNGSMDVRLIYDWSRTETPIELLDLSDRPDDGGGALRASWSLVHDDDFARYLIYLQPDGWTAPPIPGSATWLAGWTVFSRATECTGCPTRRSFCRRW